MTDLNPELIERAAKVRHESGPGAPSWWAASDSVRQDSRRRMTLALRSVADDIRAEALEDAADAMERDDWTHRDDWGVNCAYSLELRDRAAKLRGTDK